MCALPGLVLVFWLGNALAVPNVSLYNRTPNVYHGRGVAKRPGTVYESRKNVNVLVFFETNPIMYTVYKNVISPCRHAFYCETCIQCLMVIIY